MTPMKEVIALYTKIQAIEADLTSLSVSCNEYEKLRLDVTELQYLKEEYKRMKTDMKQVRQSKDTFEEFLENNDLVARLSKKINEHDERFERLRMAAESRSDNYRRVIVYLYRGCTKIMRATISEKIDMGYTDTEPQDRLGSFLFDKRTLLFPTDRGTHSQEIVFENILYPKSGKCIDMDLWDLLPLAFVAAKTCAPLNIYLKNGILDMKIIRDELCHSRVLSSSKYNELMYQLSEIFKRTLNVLTKTDAIHELERFINTTDFHVNETVYRDAMGPLHDWHIYDKCQKEVRLERFDEGQRIMIERLDQLIATQQKMTGRTSFEKLQGTNTVIGVKNCKPEEEKTLSKQLVLLLQSEISNDDVLKCELSEKGFQRVPEAVHKVVDGLSQQGYTLSDVHHGSVVFCLKSSSFEKLKDLWDMAMNGALTRLFHGVENALQLDYPEVKLEAFIPEIEWWSVTKELADALHNDILRQNEDVPDCCITSAEMDESTINDPTDMTRVRLEIAHTSEEHLLHISEVCKNGTIHEKLKHVADALKDIYCSDNIEIKVISDSGIVREKDTNMFKESLKSIVAERRRQRKKHGIDGLPASTLMGQSDDSGVSGEPEESDKDQEQDTSLMGPKMDTSDKSSLSELEDGIERSQDNEENKRLTAISNIGHHFYDMCGELEKYRAKFKMLKLFESSDDEDFEHHLFGNFKELWISRQKKYEHEMSAEEQGAVQHILDRFDEHGRYMTKTKQQSISDKHVEPVSKLMPKKDDHEMPTGDQDANVG